MPTAFKPKPGQVDFTNVRWCPVINCVLRYKGRILIVERSKKLRLYPGYWNGVSGFLDDKKSLDEKIVEEIREETGLKKENIVSYKLGQVYDQEEPRYKKTWIVHPVLVDVNSDKITIDWESKSYAWVRLSELKNYKLLPGFIMVLKTLFKNNQTLKIIKT